MGRPCSAEQWASARRFLEGELPVRMLVAGMLGVDVSALYARAAKEGWNCMNFKRRAVAQGYREVVQLARLLDPDGSGQEIDELADDPTPVAEAGEELAVADACGDTPLAEAECLDPLEMLARGSAFVSRQIARLIDRADRKGGRLDKAEIDGLVALSRMMERWEALARDRAREDHAKSEAELADILRTIDERIVELARDEAERLVAERDRAAAGDGADGRVAG